MRRFMSFIGLALLVGCASNPRFGTEVPPGSLTGVPACEVPQHFMAEALKGIDTRSPIKARVVQIRVPPEWIGDALGWFVEGEEARTSRYIPRRVWQAWVMNPRSGKGQLVPAIMKNILVAPVLSVIIADPELQQDEEFAVYVPSGAFTKLLTVSGDMLRLPASKDCLGVVDAEFLRTFPSRARAVDRASEERILSAVQADFPKPSRLGDGAIYSLSKQVLNPQAVGDLRQVDLDERTAERGMHLAFPPGPATLVSVGISTVVAMSERYVGPFGERQYALPEVETALGHYLRGYNMLRRDLEMRLGTSFVRDATLRISTEGRKSGWEIGEEVASQVRELWGRIDRLKELVRFRTKEGGAPAMKEATQPGLLPSSSP